MYENLVKMRQNEEKCARACTCQINFVSLQPQKCVKEKTELIVKSWQRELH